MDLFAPGDAGETSGDNMTDIHEETSKAIVVPAQLRRGCTRTKHWDRLRGHLFLCGVWVSCICAALEPSAY